MLFITSLQIQKRHDTGNTMPIIHSRKLITQNDLLICIIMQIVCLPVCFVIFF